MGPQRGFKKSFLHDFSHFRGLLEILECLLLFLNSSLVFGDNENYQQFNPDKECPGKTITYPAEEKYKVQRDPVIDPVMNQKATGLCYFFSAYYLIQDHVRRTMGRDDSDRVLPISEFLRQCSREKEIRDGGRTFEVLQRFRQNATQSMTVDRPTSPLEHALLDFHRTVNQGAVCQNESAAYFPIQRESFIDLVSTLQPQVVSSVQIAPFNIHVTEGTDPGIFLQEVALSLSQKVPVSIAFCPDSNSPKCTNGYHAITLVGRRSVYCDGKPHHQEWKIKNSYGGHLDGWFKADPIAASTAHHKRTMVRLEACSEDRFQAGLPPCLPEVQRPFFIYRLIQNQNVAELKKWLDNLPSTEVQRQVLNQKSYEKETPLSFAYRSQLFSREIIRLLLERGAHGQGAVEKGSNSPLIKAVQADDTELVNQLLDSGADVQWVGIAGFHAIYLVESAEMIEPLIRRGAKIKDTLRSDGRQPIHVALYRKKADQIIPRLIELGADPNAEIHDPQRPDHGKTPLCLVLEKSELNENLVRILFQYGASLEAPCVKAAISKKPDLAPLIQDIRRAQPLSPRSSSSLSLKRSTVEPPSSGSDSLLMDRSKKPRSQGGGAGGGP